MTDRERFLNVMNHKPMDRCACPVGYLLSYGVNGVWTGTWPEILDAMRQAGCQRADVL
jgi:hypothetical protein